MVYDCEERINIATLDGKDETILVISCNRIFTVGVFHKCGFYDFCKDCKNRFECATKKR